MSSLEHPLPVEHFPIDADRHRFVGNGSCGRQRSHVRDLTRGASSSGVTRSRATHNGPPSALLHSVANERLELRPSPVRVRSGCLGVMFGHAMKTDRADFDALVVPPRSLPWPSPRARRDRVWRGDRARDDVRRLSDRFNLVERFLTS